MRGDRRDGPGVAAAAKAAAPGGLAARDVYPRPLYDDSAYPEKSAAVSKVRDGSYDVRLHPGVAALLTSLGGLIRPLLELAWARQVASLNSLPEDDLQRFLFGADRAALDAVRLPLVEMQQGICFYCQRPIRQGQAHVDHFLPWARLPEDGLANLVVADQQCNIAKSDLLAAPAHLARWLGRDPGHLDRLAADLGWPLRREECWAACRTLYWAVPAGLPLWNAADGSDRRLLAEPQVVHALLARLPAA